MSISLLLVTVSSNIEGLFHSTPAFSDIFGGLAMAIAFVALLNFFALANVNILLTSALFRSLANGPFAFSVLSRLHVFAGSSGRY